MNTQKTQNKSSRQSKKQINNYSQYAYGRNSKSPNKVSQDAPLYIFNTCKKILQKETSEQINHWLIQNKITSHQLKTQKSSYIIRISKKVLQQMIIDSQKTGTNYIDKIIKYHQNNNKKCYQFFKCLKYYSFKDAEFAYLVDVALDQNQQTVSFYLHCQNIIINSFLNKNKKQFMSGVIATQQQWYKLYKKIFNMQIAGSRGQEQMIELFLKIIKQHHFQIKLSKTQYNGSQFFRVCQYSYSQLIQNGQNTFQQPEYSQQYNAKPSYYDKSTPNRIKISEKKIQRIFDRNTIESLDSEDKELIRALSYRDQNIAKLLDKKHNNMIEMIADEVEDLRRNIQQQKQKHIELEKNRQRITQKSQEINNLVLQYVLNHNTQTQRQLLNKIEIFSKTFCNNRNIYQIKNLQQQRKRLKLIQIIQAEQRQLQ